MASVFISWGSPDEVLATDLAQRLKSLGIDVYFSGVDRNPGDEIAARILAEIQSASVAVLALSNASIERKWVKDEIAWCFQRSQQKTLPLQVIPVVIGTLDEDEIRDYFRGLERVVLTDPAKREANLELLVDRIIRDKVIVPAALFAMTVSEFNALCDKATDADLDRLRKLCRSVGMGNEAANWRDTARQLFGARYANEREAYQPFGQPLKPMIDRAVTRLNERRRGLKQPPIWLAWDTDALLDPKRRADGSFRDFRRSRSRLTVVDCLSAFHEPIQEALKDMPRPTSDSRSGIVWVSPFFQSSDTEELIKDVAQRPSELQDAFSDWSKFADRSVAFHTGTATAFQQWLARAIGDLASPPEALEPARRAMEDQYPSAMHTKNFVEPA